MPPASFNVRWAQTHTQTAVLQSAGKLLLNAVMLSYSAAIVPVQLSFWEPIDICTARPTLYFDVLVDTFFLVSFSSEFHRACCIMTSGNDLAV